MKNTTKKYLTWGALLFVYFVSFQITIKNTYLLFGYHSSLPGSILEIFSKEFMYPAVLFNYLVSIISGLVLIGLFGEKILKIIFKNEFDQKCQNCGTTVKDGKFCSKCGKEYSSIDKLQCLKCGTKFKKGDKFCKSCGVKLEYSKEKISDSSANKMTNSKYQITLDDLFVDKLIAEKGVNIVYTKKHVDTINSVLKVILVVLEKPETRDRRILFEMTNLNINLGIIYGLYNPSNYDEFINSISGPSLLKDLNTGGFYEWINNVLIIRSFIKIEDGTVQDVINIFEMWSSIAHLKNGKSVPNKNFLELISSYYPGDVVDIISEYNNSFENKVSSESSISAKSEISIKEKQPSKTLEDKKPKDSSKKAVKKQGIEVKKEYYKNGNLKSEINLNSNKIPHGNAKFYHINGALKREVVFENGAEVDGVISSYDPYGNLSRTASLKNGVLDGPYIEYWTNGNLKSSIEYKNNLINKINRRCDYFGVDSQITTNNINADRIHLIDVRNKLDYTVSAEIHLLEDFNQCIDESWSSNEIFSDVRYQKEFSNFNKAKTFFEDFIKTYDFEVTDVDLKNKRQWGSKDGFDIAQQDTKIQIINANIFNKRLVLDLDFHQNEEECREYVNLNWIQGIGLIYSKKEFEDKQISFPQFTPIYEESDNEYILVNCYSSQIAEYFIDRVILENGGFKVFNKEVDKDRYSYLYSGPLFGIYILDDKEVVIQRKKPRLVSVDGSESPRGISNYSNLINNDLKGIRSIIYCAGELGNPDGKFCITENHKMINSWWDDDEKAVDKFKEIIKELDANHPVLKLSNREVIKKAKSSDFLASMSLLDMHTPDYMVGLDMGDNFMHITIMIKKEIQYVKSKI